MIQPHNDWILIKMDPESDMVAGGLLHKPETAHDTINRTAEVLAVGPGKLNTSGKRNPLGVSPGDGVVFGKFVATKTRTAEALLQYLGKDEALIRESDVLVTYEYGTEVSLL